ncbi:hypothetical protein SRHO_G00152510 [Serrasalmus rhombeus]
MTLRQAVWDHIDTGRIMVFRGLSTVTPPGFSPALETKLEHRVLPLSCCIIYIPARMVSCAQQSGYCGHAESYASIISMTSAVRTSRPPSRSSLYGAVETPTGASFLAEHSLKMIQSRLRSRTFRESWYVVSH